jgi:hypothetical protein
MACSLVSGDENTKARTQVMRRHHLLFGDAPFQLDGQFKRKEMDHMSQFRDPAETSISRLSLTCPRLAGMDALAPSSALLVDSVVLS